VYMRMNGKGKRTAGGNEKDACEVRDKHSNLKYVDEMCYKQWEGYARVVLANRSESMKSRTDSEGGLDQRA